MTQTVHRPTRSRLARALQSFAIGRLSNYGFEEHMGRPWDDVGAGQVFQTGVWPWIDGTDEFRLRGKNRCAPGARRELARMVLFLKTDQPYAWPVIGGLAWFALFVLGLLTLGLVGLPFRWWWRRQGDESLWPFVDRASYQRALDTAPGLGRRSTPG